jgi:hypothetical protein
MRICHYDLWHKRCCHQRALHRHIKIYYKKIRKAVKQALKRGDEEMPVIDADTVSALNDLLASRK